MNTLTGTQTNATITGTAEDPYGILITLSIELIQSFNEIISTIDTHSDNFFALKKVDSNDPDRR